MGVLYGFVVVVVVAYSDEMPIECTEGSVAALFRAVGMGEFVHTLRFVKASST